MSALDGDYLPGVVSLTEIPYMFLLKFLLLLLSLLVCALTSLAQVPAYTPIDNLVAWYNLDASADDASGNGNHGTAINTTASTDRTGQADGAYYFDGASSEIVIPYTPSFNAYPFTVSLWCLLGEDPNGGTLVSQYGNASWNGWVMGVSGSSGATQIISPAYMLQAPPNCNGVVSNAQCATGINYTGSIYNSQWHMLTFTIDADSGRFYVDGQWQTSQVWTGAAGSPTNTDDLRIGGTDLGDLFFFHGSIDEVGVWNRTLTPAEVELLYFGEPPSVGCTNSNACNYTARCCSLIRMVASNCAETFCPV
ncbi:MAG: LamG domain-containing protein [Flavobacteriales bacterium]